MLRRTLQSAGRPGLLELGGRRREVWRGKTDFPKPHELRHPNQRKHWERFLEKNKNSESLKGLMQNFRKNETDDPVLVTHGGPFAATTERRPGAFAVVKLGGTQYKVAKDDIIVVGKLRASIGSIVPVRDVLLVGTVHETVIGRPLIPNAEVSFHVEEQTKDEKVIVFKKRDNYRRRKGFRRDVTLLRCVDIACDGLPIQHVLFDEPNAVALHQTFAEALEEQEEEEAEQAAAAAEDDDAPVAAADAGLGSGDAAEKTQETARP